MLKLRVNEIMLFEEKTGVSFSKSQAQIQPNICQLHRLTLNVTAEERAAAIKACDDCEAPDVPMKYLAAFGWLVRRRVLPSLTWDEYIETADVEEVVAELKNLEGE